MNPHFETILAAYNLTGQVTFAPIGSGLIHKTWKVLTSKGQFVLQQVNHHVFTKPWHIAENLRLLEQYVKKNFSGYPFIAPMSTTSGDLMVETDGVYYRLFAFVENSKTFDVAPDTTLAYEAAHQFSRFTKVFSGFDAGSLRVTIPHFHDLDFRERQFRDALLNGNPQRIKRSNEVIRAAGMHTNITEQFCKIESRNLIKRRVTHHDTKISNVLFTPDGKGITVIDLDTVMPGYFISDLGDMMRTYLSPASEEESDLSQIEVREDFFEAIVSGFLENVNDVLNRDEKGWILYAGPFLIYMQAIRFLTDFLNNDVYYGARYEDHNFVRARNQFTLLAKYQEKEGLFSAILKKVG